MKAEERVIENISQMLNLAFSACELLQKSVLERNKSLLEEISRLERDGDEIKRITAKEIYRGAFLPYLRSNILRLVEDVDDILNTTDKAGKYFRKIRNFEFLNSNYEIEKILKINITLCKILSKNFISFFKTPGKLREAVIVVRILEKEADDLKHSILENLMEMRFEFWDGIFIFNFVEAIEEISDVIEETMDTLQVVVLSL